MKKADLCVALRGMAAKLDIQWACAQRLAAEQAAAGALAYNEEGEPLPNSAQLCYAGMTAAFEAMGGEWERNKEGRHWVYLLGGVRHGRRSLMLSDKMVITNGRDRFGYVRHVRLIGEQTGVSEDVYRIQETGRVCVRQWLCDDLVRWCTATKWSGGYEADTPFKDGLMLIAVDDTGAEIGMEVTYQTQWNGEGLAEKELPFSWEAVTEY